MLRTLKPDVAISKKHPELRIPSVNVAHSLSAAMLDKSIFQGVKPLRGQSHIRTFGTARHDINNMKMLMPIDYGGAMETYKSQVDVKSKMRPIKNKKIPNCSDRIERLLTQMSDGDEGVFNNLVDLLQLRTGLTKQRAHFDDCDVLEALTKHYRKAPEQIQLIEDMYQTS